MTPKLFLTSMSGPGNVDNMTEMIEPLLPYLDGVIWVLHDCPVDDPGARYLETVKGTGKVIHRGWPARHWHSMNETLFTGLIQDGDLVLWTDPLERPAIPFVARAKYDINALMTEADVSVIYYYGKPYLFRYTETLEYRQSPHWTLTGYTGRAIEWAQQEPDERQVRLNVRPIKRTDPFHFVTHYLRYYLEYPAGSNTVLLGLEQHPGGATAKTFRAREEKRLAFRKVLTAWGYPCTVAGFLDCCRHSMNDQLRGWLRGEKILSDAYWHLIEGRIDIKDTHNPADAIPIP